MKFTVVAPLLGFEDIKEVELEKIDDIFMNMKALDAEHISFTLINPYALRKYDFEVPQNIKTALEITDGSNLLVFNTIIIQDPIENSYVNFIAPLVFNTDTNKVAQVLIQENPDYGVAEQICDYLK